MKTRHYFLLSARHFWRTCKLLAQGLYHLGRHLFRNYPNPTWLVITATIAIYSFFKVGEARTERDHASHEAARLIEQMDSISNWR